MATKAFPFFGIKDMCNHTVTITITSNWKIKDKIGRGLLQNI